MSDELLRVALVCVDPKGPHEGRRQLRIAVSPSGVAQVLALAGGVVCGVGDCGACTAFSIEDAATFANLGLASAVIVSEGFLGLANMLLRRHCDPAVDLCVIDDPLFNNRELGLSKRPANSASVCETRS